MAEYFTEAVVLDKKDLGDLDARVFLFTEKLGKVRAKITSARKITSKLSPHLEPLNFANVRLVERKNDFQVADALKTGKFPNTEFLTILWLIKELSAENQPEPHLWALLKKIQIKPVSLSLLSGAILKIFGFDPKFAACDICHKPSPDYFIFDDAKYLCKTCFSRQRVDGGYFKL